MERIKDKRMAYHELHDIDNEISRSPASLHQFDTKVWLNFCFKASVVLHGEHTYMEPWVEFSLRSIENSFEFCNCSSIAQGKEYCKMKINFQFWWTDSGVFLLRCYALLCLYKMYRFQEYTSLQISATKTVSASLLAFNCLLLGLSHLWSLW